MLSVLRKCEKCSSEMDLDDLIALGHIGMLQSRKTYDVSKGLLGSSMLIGERMGRWWMVRGNGVITVTAGHW